MKQFFALILTVLIFSVNLFAQEITGAKVHGYVFGDYFYKLAGNATEVTPSQYSKVEKDFQAFQFRRLYLYLDYTFDENFNAQFLLEGNDKALEPGGKHGIFVKTAYLEWKNLIPMSSLAIGLIPTPTWSWSNSEKTWGYRSIEKTITDFRGLGSASDIGIGLKGKFDKDATFSYTLMIGNGTGQKPESNKYKKYYGNFAVKPMKDLIIEAYGDYEPAADEKSKTTLKGFASYKFSDITLGVEAVQQTQKKIGTNGADIVPFGVTFFAWAPLTSGLNAFARYDLYNPNTKVSDAGYKENFIVAGLDYMPIPNVHIMPNIWINTFSGKSSNVAKKDEDVIARITFFYVYK